MYGILGIASATNVGNLFEHACSWVAENKGDNVTRRQSGSSKIHWGTTGKGGAILGFSQDENISLAYLGSFHHPFPDWNSGSPLDDPNKTASVLLRRFTEKGTTFLDGLYGQYVVIVVDSSANNLLIACDPTGGRRAFVKQTIDGLAFSTSLIDFRGLLPEGLHIDRTLEEFLLSYEFLPQNRTLYEGVNVLKSGTIWEWRDGRLTTYRIAKPAWKKSKELLGIEIDEKSAVDELYERFMLSVEAISPTSSKVAVLLGGFDSAIVASALRRLGKQVETFTFHFQGYSYNQKYTSFLTDFLDSRHIDVHITPEVLREGIETYGLRFNQPASQAHYPIHTLEALRVMRQRGHLWCLSGDGCDEVFLGYPMVHKRARLFDRLGVLPYSIVKAGRLFFGIPALEDRCGHPCRLARNVLTVLGRRMPARGYVANRIFDDISLRRLRSDSHSFEKEFEAILNGLAGGLSNISSIRLAYKGKAVVGSNRNRNEGATGFSGVSIQSPYQHRAVADFAESIPSEMLRPPSDRGPAKNLGKHILLKMAEDKGLLPCEIIYQPKASPVTAPVDYWYNTELRDPLLRMISNLPFQYNQSYVEQLLEPKRAEEFFRKYGGISRYTSHLVSMLFTYAAYTANKPF